MRKSAVVILGCTLASPAAHAAERLMWPDEGHFYAYPAEARTENLEISASAGLTRDSNAFRLSDSEDANAILGTGDRSDLIRRLGLGLKADLKVSRQRFLLEADANLYDFDRFDFLDHTAYKLGADWKWEVGNQWAGDLGYARRRQLASLGELQGRIKDLITHDNLHFNAGYKLSPSLRLRGGLEGNRYEHSESSRSVLDNRTVSALVGVDYLSRAENFAGGQLKVTDGRYPNRQVTAGTTVDNEYMEYEASGVVGWQFAAKTRFDGRLGYTWRRHDEVRARNFNGITGRGELRYQMSPKTLVDLAAYREIRAVEDVNASYALVKGVRVGPAWAPTVKTLLQANLIYEQQDYRGDPGFALGSGIRREDKVRAARLTAGWKPYRSAELTLSLERGRRDSNLAAAEYDYNAVSLNAGIRF